MGFCGFGVFRVLGSFRVLRASRFLQGFLRFLGFLWAIFRVSFGAFEVF